jgi:uncharacterized protein (TIRG00374 family)
MVERPTEAELQREDQRLANAAVPPTAPAKKTLKKRVLFYVKLVVTLGLIGFILAQVDWPDFWQRLIDFDWWVIAAVLVIWIVALSVSVMKWQQLLLVHGLHYPLGLLHRWYLISYFLSQLLPSIIGGDAFRIYKTLQNGKHRACAVLPVFLERASGMAALLVIGAVCAVIDWWLTGTDASRIAATVAAIGAAVGVVGLVVAWALRLDRWMIDWPRTPSPVRALLVHSAEYFDHPKQVLIAAVISFAFHGMRVLVYSLLLYGLGHPLPFTQVAVVTAATTVIGMMPISLGGYGLVDGSFIGLLHAMYGVPVEVGLSVMLMTRATSLPIAVTGGFLYLSEKGELRQPDRVDVAPGSKTASTPDPTSGGESPQEPSPA